MIPGLELVPFQLGKPAEMGDRKEGKQKKTKTCKLHLKTEKSF